MSEKNEVPSDQMQSELNKTVKKYDEALRKMENEGTSEPTVQDYADARALIKKSHRANELEECMALEKNIATALSALRASWEKEREELESRVIHLEYQLEHGKESREIVADFAPLQETVLIRNKLADVLAEKQALEAELADHKKNHNTAKWSELLSKRMDQITALEAEKKGLEALNDSLTRTASEKNSLAIDRQAEIDRLKAENEELQVTLKESIKLLAWAHNGLTMKTGFGQRSKWLEAERKFVGTLKERLGTSVVDEKIDLKEIFSQYVCASIEAENSLKETIDSLTCALAEAREILQKNSDEWHDFNKIEPGHSCEAKISLHAISQRSTLGLSNPTSQRASEEMKGLRKVVQEARKSCACGARGESLDTHPHVGGCELGKAFEDYDKNRGAV